jgi:NHLM bacteriocin system secretion protein
VIEVRVQPGDRVQVGDVLAILDLPDLRDQLATSRQKLMELEQDNRVITNAQERRSALQEQTLQSEGISIPQQIQSNLMKIAANQVELLAAEKQRQAYQERITQLNQFITLTQQRLAAFDQLAQAGAVAPLSINIVNSENQVQQNQNERTRLFAQLEDLNSKEQQLASANLGLEAQNKQLSAQLESLRTQSANLQLGDLQSDVQRKLDITNLKRSIQNLETQIATDSKVISSHNGMVMTISANPGQYVQVGNPIGTLRLQGDNGADVTTVAFFTPDDANRIRPGMKAGMTPHLLTNRRFGGIREQYGAIPAEIRWVSPKTVTEQEVASIVGDSELAKSIMQNPLPYAIPDSGRATNLPVVQVRVQLKTNPNTPSGYQWTQGNGPAHKIPEGALGEARVTVEERSLISYAAAFLRWMTGIYRS